MEIHCGACHVILKDDDLIVMDNINCLKHRYCYDLDSEYIKDVDSYKNIKEKYWFIADEVVH